jgi:hypothetical protein
MVRIAAKGLEYVRKSLIFETLAGRFKHFLKQIMPELTVNDINKNAENHHLWQRAEWG